MVQLACLSVAGGWQTCVKDTDITLGPVFNKLPDLWKWQWENLFKPQEQG
jgi:hypothetical protein